jgi:NDP-sugar pyrophosphorylase family protein
MKSLDDKFIPIVLCAGLGTRLKPLTEYIPKVVCPLIDKPLAFYNIEKFLKMGFQTVHCNVHYLSEIVESELIEACKYFGYDPRRIRFWYEKDLLETGGGIARIYQELAQEAKSNLKKDLIVVSGDIVADFPLSEMILRWEKRDSHEMALMCTKKLLLDRNDATYVCENENYIIGFGEKFGSNLKRPNNKKLFTNHQIIHYSVVNASKVIKNSSIDLFFRPIIEANNKIINFNYSDDLFWFNIGTPQEYEEAINYFINNKNRINLAFSMPRDLKIKLKEKDSALKNKQNELDNSSIIISFRETKNNLNKYLSLNEICSSTGNNGSKFFIVV